MKIANIMSREVKLIKPDDTLRDAATLMKTIDAGALPVAEGDRLVGMITDGDLRRHMGPELLKSRVQDIMTKKPNTLSPGMLASAALEQINSLKRTQMFVVDKGKPIGVVHVHDLLRAGVA